MASSSYYSREHYSQRRRLLLNGDPRALICFCIDVSESMSEWWIEEGGITKYTGSSFSDGHNVQYFDSKDIKPGYAHYIKIDKLNDTLGTILQEFKRDPELCCKVAVSIVTYSNFAKVKYDFDECEELDIVSCLCKTESDKTCMGDAISTSLANIDGMLSELRSVDNDAYTPILVFMTDGTPTDDPAKEFKRVRDKVENNELYVFPLGIGESADMSLLREMFPFGGVPSNFERNYKMVRPEDYKRIFLEIKEHVRKRQKVMVTEENRFQSAPATEEIGVINNQMGENQYDHWMDFI